MPFTTREHDGMVEVRFHISRDLPERSACLAGEFNGWDPTSLPMQPEDGQLVATVALEPGRSYRFKYLLDGEAWINDHEADEYEPNDFGGDDSVIDLRLHGWTAPDPADGIPSGGGAPAE
jgi:1,4-alpha-glucan branching enzyme